MDDLQQTLWQKTAQPQLSKAQISPTLTNQESEEALNLNSKRPRQKKGRRKIDIVFIEEKSRRHITFSKRKAGIMKKAYELATLTGTQVLLLVASETGHVYTFATPKLQPLITKPDGKNLIQACLNSPDLPEGQSVSNIESSTGSKTLGIRGSSLSRNSDNVVRSSSPPDPSNNNEPKKRTWDSIEKHPNFGERNSKRIKSELPIFKPPTIPPAKLPHYQTPENYPNIPPFNLNQNCLPSMPIGLGSGGLRSLGHLEGLNQNPTSDSSGSFLFPSHGFHSPMTSSLPLPPGLSHRSLERYEDNDDEDEDEDEDDDSQP